MRKTIVLALFVFSVMITIMEVYITGTLSGKSLLGIAVSAGLIISGVWRENPKKKANKTKKPAYNPYDHNYRTYP